MVPSSDEESRSPDVPRLVTVDGSTVRIVTRQDLSDRRRPVLLINGIGTRLEMWQQFASALSGRRLLMFDLPGITGGSARGLPSDMPGLAVWLTHLNGRTEYR